MTLTPVAREDIEARVFRVRFLHGALTLPLHDRTADVLTDQALFAAASLPGWWVGYSAREVRPGRRDVVEWAWGKRDLRVPQAVPGGLKTGTRAELIAALIADWVDEAELWLAKHADKVAGLEGRR